MGQYSDAVELALKHGNVELAGVVADMAGDGDDSGLRKKLWLKVAETVVKKEADIKRYGAIFEYCFNPGYIPARASHAGWVALGLLLLTFTCQFDTHHIHSALEFLKRCPLLRIEDLIPYFPDFIVIDDFKTEICAALESYSLSIDALKQSMDESSITAEHIRKDIEALDKRYAIVEPGEQCYICQYQLLNRQFFVFPCQHAFHGDCLTQEVVKQAGLGKRRRIEELGERIRQGLLEGDKRQKAVEDLDRLVADEW
jgi:hypothetical protein